MSGNPDAELAQPLPPGLAQLPDVPHLHALLGSSPLLLLLPGPLPHPLHCSGAI